MYGRSIIDNKIKQALKNFVIYSEFHLKNLRIVDADGQL